MLVVPKFMNTSLEFYGNFSWLKHHKINLGASLLHILIPPPFANKVNWIKIVQYNKWYKSWYNSSYTEFKLYPFTFAKINIFIYQLSSLTLAPQDLFSTKFSSLRAIFTWNNLWLNFGRTRNYGHLQYAIRKVKKIKCIDLQHYQPFI